MALEVQFSAKFSVIRSDKSDSTEIHTSNNLQVISVWVGIVEMFYNLFA